MLFSVQYLRAFAALAVVALHTGWTRTDLGHAGVDVFFVISGFIMMHVSRPGMTPGMFLRARLIRVVPLYWIATGCAVVLNLTGNPDVVKSLLFWPDFATPVIIRPTLGQGWTLEYEMFFYAVFATSMALPARWRLEAVTACLVGCIVAGQLFDPASAPGMTYTNPLIAEFLFGAWLHRAWMGGRLPVGWSGLAVCGVGLAAFAAQFSGHVPSCWPSAPFVRPLAFGVPAALVVAGLLGAERSGMIREVPLLRTLGNASYATYLTHWFVLAFLQPLVHPLPLAAALPLLMTASALVGVLTHYSVERPIGAMLASVREGRFLAAQPARA